MQDEATIIIAFVYNRSGKTQLSASDIQHILSLELGWYTAADAKTFVNLAQTNKLLKKKDNILTPTFDSTTIQIPTGFKPTPHSLIKSTRLQLHKNTTPLLEKMIAQIAEKTRQDIRTLTKDIAIIQQEKQILPPIAALLIAQNHSVDLTTLYPDVEHYLFTIETEE
jgi:hypothetical protein